MKAAFLEQGHRDAAATVPASRAALSAWLDAALDRVEDASFGERFAAACPVAGCAAAAYRHRLLADPSGPVLLAGIRFLGGDVGQPFVDLLAWDRPVTRWEVVIRRLLDAFSGFAPRTVRLRWPGGERPPIEGLQLDQWLVAGRIGDLRRRPWPTGALAVRAATDLSFLATYDAAFDAWRASVGARGEEVVATTADDFLTCIQHGAVLCATDGGSWAGVVAAAPGAERLVDGFCVHEELLDAPLRGRGLAPLLQRHLIERLPAQPDDVLWGTIHATNAPSLATARRCGREVVEGWWFASA